MQRMLGRERVGRMVDHVLRLVADGQDAMGAFLDCDDGGLVDDDAFAGNGDQGIRGAEVDSHVARHLTGETREEIQE